MKTTVALLLLLAACSGDDVRTGDGSGDVLDETVYASFWYDNPCFTFADCGETDCTAREIGATLHVSMEIEARNDGYFAGWMNRFCVEVGAMDARRALGFDAEMCCSPSTTLLTVSPDGCAADQRRAPTAEELSQMWCWPPTP